jgi:hypothetical protein
LHETLEPSGWGARAPIAQGVSTFGGGVVVSAVEAASAPLR